MVVKSSAHWKLLIDEVFSSQHWRTVVDFAFETTVDNGRARLFNSWLLSEARARVCARRNWNFQNEKKKRIRAQQCTEDGRKVNAKNGRTPRASIIDSSN